MGGRSNLNTCPRLGEGTRADSGVECWAAESVGRSMYMNVEASVLDGGFSRSRGHFLAKMVSV